jgi:hypothetical protein
MRLVDRLGTRRSITTLDGLADTMQFGGHTYPLGLQFSMPGSKHVDIDHNFDAYVSATHRQHGVVSACVLARALLLSQVRFRWRDVTDGPQAQTYGTEALAPLERPSPWLTRPRLLMQAEQHVSYGGNAYFHLAASGRLRLLRPDWLTVVIGSDQDPDTPADQLDGEVVGYLYRPGGLGALGTGQVVPASEVAHWAPEPDPRTPWLGESWVTSVLKDIITDRQAGDHLAKFFENAGTPNLVFSLDKSVNQEGVRKFAAMVDGGHTGVDNAYRNLFLGGGASVNVVGSRVGDLAYKDITGGFETRIAARARIPAAILGIREGLAGSALNAGNYSSARRAWSDGWFSPTADGLCAALEAIITPPNTTSELTFDAARVMFLQEDRKDEAEIQTASAATIRQLIEAGFEPASAVEAVRTGDFSVLRHTGMTSVQLQAPGADGAATAAEPVEEPPQRTARLVAELLQKGYLAVQAGVITAEELRVLANQAGGHFTGPAPQETPA